MRYKRSLAICNIMASKVCNEIYVIQMNNIDTCVQCAIQMVRGNIYTMQCVV